MSSWINPGVAVSEAVLVAAPAKFYTVLLSNSGASARYAFIFDAAVLGGSRPSNGATSELIVPIAVDPGKQNSIRLTVPRGCLVGLSVSISSTLAAFTYDASATFQISAEIA